MILDDSNYLEARAAAVVDAGAIHRRVQVHVRAGVPRSRLLNSIARRLAGAAVVVLPPLHDPDASLHGLLQAAARLGPSAVEQATQEETPLRDRARSVGQALASANRTLVTWVPASWAVSDETGNPGRQVRRLRAEEVLGGWLSVSDLSIILVSHPSSAGLIARSAGAETDWQSRQSIDPPAVSFPDESAWGSYANAAALLQKTAKRQPGLRWSGLQLRLLVGLVALGQAPDRLLAGALSPRDLGRQISDLLLQLAGRDVADGVRRFLHARRPVPRELARQIAHVPEGHLPLITDCLAEGDDILEVEDGLREGLLARRPPPGQRHPPDAAVHLALADYHQSLDGAPGPTAAWNQIDHWLEKAHHLGLSGPLGAERWSKLERPSRDFYWDRARSLSVDHEEHEAAAELYQECIDRFDRRDAYSWHYLGYNLDRAGVRRKDAESAFREAVKLRPDHPWYNGRLVTFLIEQARFRAAREEWYAALERMDPDRENVALSPWLAKESHRWVVKAWLRFGEVARAREVLDDIPEESFAQERWYLEIRQAVEDAEEAIRLGESVYPSSTAMSERWIVPREVLMRAPAGCELRSWFPGRVAGIDEDGVHLALAVPQDEAQKRRLISRTLTPEEWRRHAHIEAKEERFVFLAIYEDATDPQGIVQIFAQPERTPRFQDEVELQTTLRYLRRGSASGVAGERQSTPQTPVGTAT